MDLIFAFEILGFLSALAVAGLWIVHWQRGRRLPGSMAMFSGLLGVTCVNHLFNALEWSPFTVPSYMDGLEDSADLLAPLFWWLWLYSCCEQIVFRRDLAERRRQLMRLRFQSSILDGVQESVVAMDLDGRVVFWGRGAERLYGQPAEEALGTRVTFAVDPAVVESEEQRIQTVLERGYWQGQFEQRRRDGTRFWADTRISLLSDDEGEPCGFICVDRDISEQRRAENELTASELRFRTLVENSFDVVSLTDRRGRFLYVSPSVKRLLDFDPSELKGTPNERLVHPQDQEVAHARFMEQLEQVGSTSQFAYRLRHRDGSYRAVEVTCTNLLEEPGINAMLSILRDITEGEVAKAALEESEQRWRSLVQHAPEAIVVFDADEDRFVECNDHALAMFGLSREQLLNASPLDVSPPQQPDGTSSAEAGQGWVDRTLQGETPVFEWTHCNAAGECFPCEVRLLNLPPEKDRLIRGSMLNIAERKQIEKEREALIRDLEQKNAELERFTYTVSHDLKSPLITIKGFLGFLERDIEDGNVAALCEDVEEIAAATDKMHELLTELLDLSRIGRLTNEPESIDWTELAEEAVSVLAGLADENGVEIDIEPGMPTVQGDRIRLREVLQNLAENSIKFSRHRSHAVVRIGARRDNDQTVFYVADNGIGIDPRFADRIFGLFEQLDPNIEGTGIGLAVVKRIIEVHGGKIWVESKGLDQGARFCFTLPVVVLAAAV